MREDMQDIEYCLARQQEYDAKARMETNARLKAAYEAVTREFARRVRELVTNRLNERI